jgi:hypothetical protein
VGRDNRYKVEFEDGTTTTIKAWNYRRAWRLASRTGRKVVRVWQDKSISEKPKRGPRTVSGGLPTLGKRR